MDKEILAKASSLIELTNGNICNHCLGRKFSDVVEGNGNVERGEKIRKALELPEYDEDTKCDICSDIFKEIDSSLLDLVCEKIDFLEVEFDTFVVGCKLPKEMVEKDAEISEKLGLDVEILKREVNREMGKLLEKNLSQEVDFDKEDVTIMADFRKFLRDDVENPIKVRIQINPIFIEGRYNKLVRNIPQTKWPCRKCKGRGCEACNFTGKQYPESVEELLSQTALKEPRIRKLDLEKIEREANEAALGKTAYHNLKYTVRKRKAEIKTSSPDTYKVYRALVECEDEIMEEDLDKLQSLHTIQQRTPIRVSHRRADKIREKEVKELSCKYINPHSFEMIIKTEGGLYIKELISSDEGRSKPSVSEVLGTQAICAELDVIEVGIK